jgi:hypothetical protein
MDRLPWHQRWCLASRVLNAFWLADFRPVAPAIHSPDGTKFIVPMKNRCYADMARGRLVTFDVRDAQGQFMHHIQSEIAAEERWAIGWCGSNTVVVKGSLTGINAYVVGIDSMYYPVPEPLSSEIIESAATLA